MDGTLSPRTTVSRRLLAVLILTLLPWPAVWLGMYRLHSLVLTFILYHGVCLLPASLWGYRLWRGDLRWPTRREWAIVILATVAMLPASVLLYSLIGSRLMSASDILHVLTYRGFQAAWYLPVTFYFVPVNAILEELFWRGVVLNELKGMNEAQWTLGASWTAFTFAAWHYLVLRLLLRPGWAELSVAVILAAGIFLDWLYRRTKSIIVPILWHGLVFDLALLVIFGVMLRAGVH